MSPTQPHQGSTRPRVLVATVAGIAFVLAYIVGAVTLPDLVPHQHWAAQALYWCVAGVLWVFPVWALMLFAAGRGRRASARKARA